MLTDSISQSVDRVFARLKPHCLQHAQFLQHQSTILSTQKKEIHTVRERERESEREICVLVSIFLFFLFRHLNCCSFDLEITFELHNSKFYISPDVYTNSFETYRRVGIYQRLC